VFGVRLHSSWASPSRTAEAAVPTCALRYHVSVHSLAERVLSHIRRQELLRAGDRVGVAVSGGIDSVALLRLLLELRGELGIVLSVVHFNHKLRGAESEADQEFVAALSRTHDLEFFCDSDDVAQQAAEDHVSVESAARELRYGFFRYLLGSEGCLEGGPSGAEAQIQSEPANRSTESAAPPKGGPRGLKPDSENSLLRRPERPPFHGTANAMPFSIPGYACHLNKIVTGHTLDDQAETVLMRMIRGAGLRGLGGIHPRIAVENDDGEICGEIVRPLLTFRRHELKQYLNDIGQGWREDATNADPSFTRNRVRKLVVPLLENEFNPAVAENLAELAEIARGEEDYWENEVSGWMGTAVHWSEPVWARDALSQPTLVQIETGDKGSEPDARSLRRKKRDASRGSPRSPATQTTLARDDIQFASLLSLRSRIESASWLVMNASIDRLWFLGEPVAVQRRLVKAVGEHAGIPLEFKHVEEILQFAAEDGPSGKHLSLPLGWKMLREHDQLVFVTPDLRERDAPTNYEYELRVPGQTVASEAGVVFDVRRIPAAAASEYNADHLLDAESLPRPLTVRNWRPGDRFWPAHTKSPKKIKELLQERHVAQPERRLWPVVASGKEIVWVRGFPSSIKFRARPGHHAILIAETPLAENAVT
jgi:tRNA(Ile)-lysidine synthetase-like protein